MFSKKTKNKVWTLQITCTVIDVRKWRSLQTGRPFIYWTVYDSLHVILRLLWNIT